MTDNSFGLAWRYSVIRQPERPLKVVQKMIFYNLPKFILSSELGMIRVKVDQDLFVASAYCQCNVLVAQLRYKQDVSKVHSRIVFAAKAYARQEIIHRKTVHTLSIERPRA